MHRGLKIEKKSFLRLFLLGFFGTSLIYQVFADDQLVFKVNRLSNFVKVACQKEDHSVCREDFAKFIQNHWKVYCSRESKESTPEGFKKDFKGCYERLISRREGLFIKPKNQFLDTTLEYNFLKQVESIKSKLSLKSFKRVDAFLEKVLEDSSALEEMKSPFIEMYYSCPRNLPFSDCLKNFRSKFSEEKIKRQMNRFSYLGRLKNNFINTSCDKKMDQELMDVLAQESLVLKGRHTPARLYCFYKLNKLTTQKLFQFAKNKNPFSKAPTIRLTSGEYSLPQKKVKEYFKLLKKYPSVDIKPEYLQQKKQFQTNAFLSLTVAKAQYYNFFRLMCSIPHDCNSYFSVHDYRLKDQYGVGSFIKSGKSESGDTLYPRTTPSICEGQLEYAAKMECTKFYDDVFWSLTSFFKEKELVDKDHLSVFLNFSKKLGENKDQSLKSRMESQREVELCGTDKQLSFVFNYQLYPFDLESKKSGIKRLVSPLCKKEKVEEVVEGREPTEQEMTQVSAKSSEFEISKECSEKYCLIYVKRIKDCSSSNRKECYQNKTQTICKEDLASYQGYQQILYRSCSH